MQSKVFIRSVADLGVEQAAREILDGCGWQQIVAPGAAVVVKPNLNTPDPAKAASANTDPRLLAAVLRILLERTSHVVVGEADGPRHAAELAARVSGVDEVCRELGVPFVNFSNAPTRPVDHPLLRDFELPAAMLDADVLVTLPVIKTHALTSFTGAIKNQWGCVPRHDRILLHRYLDRLLADLVGVFRPRLAVMDGIVGVEGRGPTNGKPRRLDVLLGSSDVVALDATAMRLIGLAPRSCAHLVLAHEAGHGALEASAIAIDGDFERHRCRFEPAELDWAVRAMNYLTRYPFFTHRILFNDAIFKPARWMVQQMRAAGVL